MKASGCGKFFVDYVFFFQPEVPACSCVDCEASCPVPPPEPQPSKTFTIFGVDGVPVIMGIIWAVGSLVFLVAVVCCCDSKNTIGNVSFSQIILKGSFQLC
jgi:hypothetical protein